MPELAALEEILAGALAAREPRAFDGDGPRPAAVTVILFERVGTPHVLLTKRSDDLPSHPGQIAFPGGVVEPDDASHRAAALRETEEEVGIPPTALRVIGQLDDVGTMASNYVIRPFVAVHAGPLRAVASDREVARILEVPLDAVLAADAAMPGVPPILLLRYPLLGEDVWGATARILRDFCRLARVALAATREG